MRHRAVASTIAALAIVLLAGPSLLGAQESSPSAEGSSILTEYGEAWSSGDASQVAALYTEDAVREDIPTGTTSRGRAEIEAFATGLFETDATRKETGGEVTFRGASVLELADGQISRETDYYDLPQMQQQIAAAGGTPGALEPSAGGTDATPGTTAAAEQTGSVTIRDSDRARCLRLGGVGIRRLRGRRKWRDARGSGRSVGYGCQRRSAAEPRTPTRRNVTARGVPLLLLPGRGDPGCLACREALRRKVVIPLRAYRPANVSTLPNRDSVRTCRGRPGVKALTRSV
ncbi:MAG: SnoaL-like polyketide cyclase [Thermomicrobiales bacterium]|nr:SnoaL-like polyketide cyclase [Thermomicrobiales bacterium]